MNRTECELLIAEKLREIRNIYKEYYPNGNYMHLCICNNKVTAFNEYFDQDSKKPINFTQHDDEEIESRVVKQ